MYDTSLIFVHCLSRATCHVGEPRHGLFSSESLGWITSRTIVKFSISQSPYFSTHLRLDQTSEYLQYTHVWEGITYRCV